MACSRWPGMLMAGSLAVAGAGTQLPPDRPERLAQMRHHFTQAGLLHEAIIRGDLAAARVPAQELASIAVPGGVPAASLPHITALREAARGAAGAGNLATAAVATATVLTTCGDCHRAAGVMPATPAVPAPKVGGIVGHMLEHQRALDEMLAGLLIPSVSEWRAGSLRLQGAPLKRSELRSDPKLTSAIARAEQRVHQLADRATMADDVRARRAIYGDLLTTCAECHALHGVVWGPRRPGVVRRNASPPTE